MDFIINFYKELDTLNLIIFWGIIIVIILLLIFSFILINKNNKLKKIVDKQNKQEEDLPILIKDEKLFEKNVSKKLEQLEKIENTEEIKIENNFVAEEHVLEYRKNLFELSNKTTEEEQKVQTNINTKKEIEIPNAPYQKNVLREMSLSQTSPIGINRQEDNKKIEIVKDLEESLKNEDFESNIDDLEINNNINKSTEKESPYIEKSILEKEYPKESKIIPIIKEQVLEKEQNQNEQYLEEVSRKLAEAEIPDEIERTNYEIKQEEDAIISYKELMAKKDTIETIDEEDAIISIEELMNRNNIKKEQEDNSKLYKLSEEEENENFIKELKQFRKDL